MAYLIFGGLTAALVAVLWHDNHRTPKARPRHDFYIWQEGDSLNAAQEWEQRRQNEGLDPANSNWWMTVPVIIVVHILAFMLMA